MRNITVAALGAVLLVTSPGVIAQTPTPLGSSSQTARPPYVDRSRDGENPVNQSLQEQIEKGRQSERQKKLIADTDRLLALANELKIDVDKTTKDQMSIQVIHKAEEIEKLARSVKERMKG